MEPPIESCVEFIREAERVVHKFKVWFCQLFCFVAQIMSLGAVGSSSLVSMK